MSPTTPPLSSNGASYRRVWRVGIWILASSITIAACGPTDRRSETNAAGTPTPTATATATISPSPSPSPSPTLRVSQAFVRVVGTAGTPFVGQLLDGSGSRSVDGVVPQDFVLSTPRGFISASFSKTEAGLATITAQVFVDGMLISEQSTTTNFGSVTVNVPLP